MFNIVVPYAPIVKIRDILMKGISDYWLSKKLWCYMLLFIPAFLSTIFFLPFIIFYFIDRLLSFDDEIGFIPLAVKRAKDITNSSLRIFSLILVYIVYIIFYLLSLIFSLPVYVCCWIFGGLDLLFTFPMIKIMDKLNWSGNGYTPKSKAIETYNLLQETIEQGKQTLENLDNDKAVGK